MGIYSAEYRRALNRQMESAPIRLGASSQLLGNLFRKLVNFFRKGDYFFGNQVNLFRNEVNYFREDLRFSQPQGHDNASLFSRSSLARRSVF